MSTPATSVRYVPAAGRRGLTRLYDPAMALTMRERRWRPRLIDELLAPAAGRSPRNVLDVGCGTGTLAVELAVRAPRTHVTGVDGDAEVLRLAASKAILAGAELDLRAASATALPFEGATFDRVVCSLLLHHLAPAQQAGALREAARVLRPGGRLVVADWGAPPDPLMRAAFTALRALDGFSNTEAHAAGRLPDLIAAAGFQPAGRRARWRTTWGSLEILVAER